MLSGIFVGYDQRAGGSWSEDIRIVDWDELEQAETAGEVHVKRIAWKEVTVLTPFRFPLATGDCKQPAFRTSAKHPARDRRKTARV